MGVNIEHGGIQRYIGRLIKEFIQGILCKVKPRSEKTIQFIFVKIPNGAGALFCWVYGRGRLQNPRRSVEQRSRRGEEERRTEEVPPSTASKGLEIIGRYGDCGLTSARGAQGDGIADETEKAPDSQKESGAFG